MSINQKLNAAELIEQSNRLNSLKDEYDAMFKNVNSILNEMNEGWSEYLSNNFSTKISSAQNGFSKILDMLECGAFVAKESAQSFEEVNAVMSRTISNNFSSLFKDATGFTFEEVSGAIADPGFWNGVGDNIKNEFTNPLTGKAFTLKDYGQAIMDPWTWQNVWKDMQSSENWREYFKKFGDVGDAYNVIGKAEQSLGGAGVFSMAGGLMEGISKAGQNFVDVFEGKNEHYNAYEESMTTTFVDALMEGNYAQATAGYIAYTAEAATGFVLDTAYDGISGIIKESGVTDYLPIAELEASLGMPVDTLIDSVADGIQQGVSDMVDTAVRNVGYVEDVAQAGFAYVGDLFNDVGSWMTGVFK